jgi:hypothetical protein
VICPARVTSSSSAACCRVVSTPSSKPHPGRRTVTHMRPRGPALSAASRAVRPRPAATVSGPTRFASRSHSRRRHRCGPSRMGPEAGRRWGR